jgi:hypothetical protein
MEVHFKPETELRLQELASKSGRLTDDLLVQRRTSPKSGNSLLRTILLPPGVCARKFLTPAPLFAEVLVEEAGHDLVGFLGFGERGIVPERVGEGFEDD